MLTNMQRIIPEYAKYNTVKRYVTKLKKRSASDDASESTLYALKYGLRNYLEYTKTPDPDQLIETAKAAIRQSGCTTEIDDVMDDFWAAMPRKTTAALHFNTLKGFYKANGINLSTETATSPIIRQQEIIPNKQQIEAILRVTPLQHTSWILANNYLGLRIEAVTLLTVDDLHTENWSRQQPLYPVTIRQELSGTFTYEDYIGADAMINIRHHINNRDLNGQDHVWGYNKRHLIAMFKKYAYTAGIITAPHGLGLLGEPKGLSPLHNHCLRKRKQTIQESVGTPQNWVDYMMGHMPRGAQGKAYSRPNGLTPDALYNEKLKALPQFQICN